MGSTTVASRSGFKVIVASRVFAENETINTILYLEFSKRLMTTGMAVESTQSTYLIITPDRSSITF